MTTLVKSSKLPLLLAENEMERLTLVRQVKTDNTMRFLLTVARCSCGIAGFRY